VLRAHSIVRVRVCVCVCIVIHTYTNTPLFTVIMAPQRKSSDAASASRPKRSRDVLSISEKVKIRDMIEIEKKYEETARFYAKNETSIRAVMKNKENNSCKFFCCTANCKSYCYNA
jgi:hypothetical protein